VAILGIENRTENWKTSLYFSPLLRDKNARLRLVRELGESERTRQEDVHIELYWYGIRDHIHQSGGAKESYYSELAERYGCLFPDLRKTIQNYGRFKRLKDCNYDMSSKRRRDKLGSNIYHTEIDIVLESPNGLFIGEAKHFEDFGADGKQILVHQLIRQYVMARILLDRLGYQKDLIPFVVGDDAKRIARYSQVDFMIKKSWMRKEDILEWEEVKEFTRNY